MTWLIVLGGGVCCLFAAGVLYDYKARRRGGRPAVPSEKVFQHRVDAEASQNPFILGGGSDRRRRRRAR